MIMANFGPISHGPEPLTLNFVAMFDCLCSWIETVIHRIMYCTSINERIHRIAQNDLIFFMKSPRCARDTVLDSIESRGFRIPMF